MHQDSQTSALQNAAATLIRIALFLLPFHAFLSVFFNFGLGVSALARGAMVFNYWKEGVLIVLTVLLFLFMRDQQKKSQKFIQLDLTDKLLLAFFAFGFLHFALLKIGILKGSTSFALFLWGVKYDFLFLWSFFITKHFHFSSQQLKKFFKAVIIAASLSLILGFIIQFVLKPENLTLLGFRNDWSTWFPNQSLAFCQRVENLSLCRMAGTFAGPNQLGAYLVVLLPLMFLWYRERKNWFNSPGFEKIFSERTSIFIVIVLAFAALFFTFSRAAYLGAVIALVIILACHTNFQRFLKKYWPLLGAALLLVAVIFLIKKNVFLRPGSNTGHLEAFSIGVQQMLNHPLGQGLGTAGPASYHSPTPLIPENWYLQVAIELGFIGLALFIAVMISLAFQLFQKKERTLFASFIALAIMAFFLHIYEDAPTNLTFFMLIGAAIGSSK